MSLFITTPTITVLIGPPSSRTEVSVHRSLAISHSTFFAQALSGNWSNSDTNTIDLHSVLPNMDSEHLAQYLEELYASTPTLKSTLTTYDIIHVYIVAEALLDRETRNRAVRSLHEAMFGDTREYLYDNLVLVAKIYAHTASSDNPMRRLLVDAWYDGAESDWFDYETAPKEFLWDLHMKGFERAKSTTPLSAKYDVEDYMELTEAEMKDKKEMAVLTEEHMEKVRLMREKKERKEKLIEMSRTLAENYAQRRTMSVREFLDQTADVGSEEDEEEVQDEVFPLAGGDDDDEMEDELFGPAGGDGEDDGIDDEMFPLAGGEEYDEGIEVEMSSDDGEYDSLSDEELSDDE